MTALEPVAGSGRTLAECERVIDDGMPTLLAVSAALAEIRDRRLYLDGYATWAAYCEGRWKISERTARRRIEVARAAAELPVGAQVPSQRQIAAARADGRTVRAAGNIAPLERLLRTSPGLVAGSLSTEEGARLHAALAVWVADFHDALRSGRKIHSLTRVIDASAAERTPEVAEGASSLDREGIDAGAVACPHSEVTKLPYGTFCVTCRVRIR